MSDLKTQEYFNRHLKPEEQTDKFLLNFLDENKGYVIAHAPSGDYSAFVPQIGGATCYGKSIRDCLKTLVIMHRDISPGE